MAYGLKSKVFDIWCD